MTCHVNKCMQFAWHVHQRSLTVTHMQIQSEKSIKSKLKPCNSEALQGVFVSFAIS